MAEELSIQDRIQEAIQADAPEETPGALCTGWVVVAEWCDSDGKLWLSRADSDNMTAWKRTGMLHDALYGDSWEISGDSDGDES